MESEIALGSVPCAPGSWWRFSSAGCRSLHRPAGGAAGRRTRASDKSKSVGAFGESRRGDVPEGTLEMITPETDRAIQNGLAWLAQSAECRRLVRQRYVSRQHRRHQPGRAWPSCRRARVPGRGPYGSQIEKALAYVMENTSPSGFIAVPSSSTHGPMYSHGFGTLFLAEAYGMTHRPEIREKLQKAVRLIIDTQNNEGGWRYQPVRRDADLSVTICQINALRFDAIGLAFEGYGPVGEFRTIDLGGRPVDTRATFPGGGEGTGVDGLRAYLREHRAGGVRRQPLPQAAGLRPRAQPAPLGRRDASSSMRTRLAADGDRFGGLVESIVTSPQFRNKRVEGDQAEECDDHERIRAGT